MKSTNTTYTLDRMSGTPVTLRKWLTSPSFLKSPIADPKADRKNYKIDFSNYYPFCLSEKGKNNLPKQLEEIASNQFIDDSKLNLKDYTKEVDRRLTNMMHHYRSNASSSPSRSILVLGAGPVGLRCAIGAALAGNQVTVIEQYCNETRARYLGLFSPEQYYLAEIGAPKSIFTEVLVNGIPKRAITLPDMHLLLKSIALKLGVELRLNAKAVFDNDSLKEGAILCIFSPSRQKTASHFPSHILCLKHNISKGMGQKSTVKFDVLVDASGTHSKLKPALFGKEVVGFKTISKDELIFGGKEATMYHSRTAPEGVSFLFDQSNNINRWEEFVEKVLEEHTDITDNIDCFVSNIDRSIFKENGLLDLSDFCPPDWIWKLFSRSITNDLKSREYVQNRSARFNDDIFRIHLEGILPHHFNGSRTRALLYEKNREPVDIIEAFIKVSGAGEHIHKENWNRYCMMENGSNDPTQNSASLFNTQLSGIRTYPDRPSLWGIIPGTTNKEYFIAGDAAQSAWYRFGTGIMDGFYSASVLDELLRIGESEKIRLALKWERYLRQRAVQVLYSIYLNEQLLRKSPFMHQMFETLCSDMKATTNTS